MDKKHTNTDSASIFNKFRLLNRSETGNFNCRSRKKIIVVDHQIEQPTWINPFLVISATCIILICIILIFILQTKYRVQFLDDDHYSEYLKRQEKVDEKLEMQAAIINQMDRKLTGNQIDDEIDKGFDYLYEKYKSSEDQEDLLIAKTTFENLIKRDRQQRRAYYGLSDCFRILAKLSENEDNKRKNYEESLNNINIAIELEENYFSAYMLRARIIYALGNNDKGVWLDLYKSIIDNNFCKDLMQNEFKKVEEIENDDNIPFERLKNENPERYSKLLE